MNHAAAGPQRAERRLERRFLPRAFDRHIHAARLASSAGLHHVLVARVDHVEAEVRHMAGLRRVGLADDDRRAGRGGGQRRQGADRARARDQHHVPRGDAAGLDSGPGHCGRLDQRALLPAHGIGHRDDLGFVEQGQLAHPAPRMAQAD